MTMSSELLKIRLLATLEEPGEQNIYALLNTVLPGDGTPSALEAYAAALAGLLNSGHLELGLEDFYPRNAKLLPRDAGLELIARLPELFRFDGAASKWNVAAGEIHKQTIPFAKLTELGIIEARRILDDAGFKWWDRRLK